MVARCRRPPGVTWTTRSPSNWRAMADALAPIADKLKRFIRLLSSDNDHEALGAARALLRTLNAANLDIHALADSIGAANGKKFSEQDAIAIYRRGVEDGRREAEKNQDIGFRNVNAHDEPSWHDIACECGKHSDRLRRSLRARLLGRDLRYGLAALLIVAAGAAEACQICATALVITPRQQLDA